MCPKGKSFRRNPSMEGGRTKGCKRGGSQHLYVWTGRMHALKIMEHTLNASPVRVYDQVSRPERKSARHIFLTKRRLWLRRRSRRSCRKNSGTGFFAIHTGRNIWSVFIMIPALLYGCRFDGNFLSLPDLNPEVSLYPHQKSAVARIVLEKDVLLNHAVGSGKTIFHDCGYP